MKHLHLQSTKGIFWGGENGPKWPYYEENKSKIAIFRVKSSQIIGRILKFSTSSSQIWLSLLKHDHQSTYFTKLFIFKNK
jgi:hypothetical protein